MATLTLGQMLDAALGSPKTEAIDFEQLRNLLNGMLAHLGLRDVPVQESGEPLEGEEGAPPSLLEQLKQKVEANEREIAEVRALCEGLREEVSEMKAEQSRMAEDMEKMQETLDPENFQNMLEHMLEMSAMKEGRSEQESGPKRTRPWDDHGLIVIGNEIILAERPRTPTRHRDSRAPSPLPPKATARAQGRGKDLLQEPAGSHLASVGARDMGQNVGQSDTGQNTGWNVGRRDMGRKGMGWNVGRKGMGWNVGQKNMGWKDMGQEDMGQIKDEEIKISISEAEAIPNPLDASPERNDVGQIKDEEIKISTSKVEALPSPLDASPERNDVGQIKDEEIKITTSKVEALPSPLDASPERNDVGQIKDEEIKISTSKAAPHVPTKSLDSGSTALGMHPGSHPPVQRVQSAPGHAGSRTVWIPAESFAGTSSRLPTSKEAQGGGSPRMEPFPAVAGMKLLKVPSSEYLPSDPRMQLPGWNSEVVPSTAPPSPGFSGRLPRALKQPKTKEHGHRDGSAEGYSRGSPRYCGGKHTSTFPMQPMEPLLPDPNKPGAFELVGKDGLVYRGRSDE